MNNITKTLAHAKIHNFSKCLCFCCILISLGVHADIASMSHHTAATKLQNQSNKQMTQEILKLVNQYRLQYGLSALTMLEDINIEARQNSLEMAQHHIPFGHAGFTARIKRLQKRLSYVYNGAENVAYRYKTAKIVVDGWMHSAGHKRNILGKYNMTGIGLARDANGYIYFTQLFLNQEIVEVI